ncbi:hypothetical protein ABTF07_19475, partial [Acinetobacter baumannii]
MSGRVSRAIAALLSMTATAIPHGVDASPLMHTNFGGDSRHAWTASVPAPALHGRGVRALSAPILPNGHLTQSEGVIT